MTLEETRRSAMASIDHISKMSDEAAVLRTEQIDIIKTYRNVEEPESLDTIYLNKEDWIRLNRIKLELDFLHNQMQSKPWGSGMGSMFYEMQYLTCKGPIKIIYKREEL